MNGTLEYPVLKIKLDAVTVFNSAQTTQYVIRNA
jgi:hypothetical protein